MAGKGGGAWKVAYADFVTAMMAFFLVMWIVGQNKEVKQAVAQYFREPFGTTSKASGSLFGLPSNKDAAVLNGKRSKSVPLVASRRSGSQGAGPGPGASPGETPKATPGTKPAVVALHDGNRRMLGGVILFAEDSGELSATAKDQLKHMVPALLGKRNKIEIRGHAARRASPPRSSIQDPWQISYARCMATMKYLEKEGVEPDRIRLSQAGAFEPQTIRAELDRQAPNSRVEVYALTEFAEDLVGTREERAERFRNP